MLSLIDQGLDACKYLISQGLWHIALVYSKVLIYCLLQENYFFIFKIYPNCDFVEIYTRYAEHLILTASDRNVKEYLFL